jgi:hypothetical protein
LFKISLSNSKDVTWNNSSGGIFIGKLKLHDRTMKVAVYNTKGNDLKDWRVGMVPHFIIV